MDSLTMTIHSEGEVVCPKAIKLLVLKEDGIYNGKKSPDVH